MGIRHHLLSFTLALLAAAPATLLAQSGAAPPANLLSVFRESVKVGKGPAHDALETAWSGALIAAKTPVRMVAISSLTGPAEIWYIAPYESWAAYEKSTDVSNNTPALSAIDKKFRAQEDQYLSDARGMTLRPRAELSFGPLADLPNMRYISVTRINVRPGHTAEYEEARKMVRAAHEKARLTDSYTIWQATAGAPAGTFYQFVARKTLVELDSTATIHGAAYIAALGGEEGQKKLAALEASGVNTQQTDHFEMTPSQSVPPDEWVKANPKMWERKLPAAPKKP